MKILMLLAVVFTCSGGYCTDRTAQSFLNGIASALGRALVEQVLPSE